MLRLVEDRQPEIGEIDERRVELAVLGGEVVEPARDGRADPARTGAGDDGMQLE